MLRVEKILLIFYPLISLYINFIMVGMKNYGGKNEIIFFPRLVSMEMVAIFEFRALTKVHITLKPLL